MFGSSPLAGLFARSPFGPLQEHMKAVDDCVAELVPLAESLLRGEHAAVRERKEKIFALEHRADEIKHEIREHLPRSLFMPVDRRDLLDLLHIQDSIADDAQDVAGLLFLRELEVPEPFRDLLLPFVERVRDAVRQCKKTIDQLDELLELGFRGREAEYVEKHIVRLSAIETETDDQGMELTRRLFEIERDMSPGTFFLWYELFQKLGDVADHAEGVGDRLRLLIAR